MKTTEEITARHGVRLFIEKSVGDDTISVSVKTDGRTDCLLHWGLCARAAAPWEAPPESIWPAGTKPFDRRAVQTPFARQNGTGRIDIKLDRSRSVSCIPFVLYFPKDGRWDNNNGRDYTIMIAS